MSGENISDWVMDQLSSGGRLVLLETYIDHIIIGILRADKLLVAMQRDMSATDYFIGMGYNLPDYVGTDSILIIEAGSSSARLPEAPVRLTVQLRSYHGRVELMLKPSKQHGRKFTIHV